MENQKLTIGQNVFVATKQAVHPATIVGFEADNHVKVRYSSNGTSKSVKSHFITAMDKVKRSSRSKRATASYVPTPKKRRAGEKSGIKEEKNVSSALFFSEDEAEESTARVSKKTHAASSGWGTNLTSTSAFVPGGGWGAITRPTSTGATTAVGGWGRASGAWGDRKCPTSTAAAAASVGGQGTSDIATSSSRGGWRGATSGGWGKIEVRGSTSASQVTFPPPMAKQPPSTQAALPHGKPVPIIAESNEFTFASYMFDGRLKVKQIKLPGPKEFLERELEFDKEPHSLFVVKFEKGDGRGLFASSKMSVNKGNHVDAYYLMPADNHDIASELLSIANFEDQPVNKNASRFQLMISPASKSTCKEPRAWLLPDTVFELMEDDNDKHMGCGFIPVSLLQELAPGAAAVQVRIFVPSLGIFKGMLMSKVGIKKIQLFESMQKVGKTLKPPHTKLKGKAFLLFKNVMPSKSAEFIDRKVNPRLKNPPPSAEKELKSLCRMFQTLLTANGVPVGELDLYLEESCFFVRRNHHSAVGVSDPTNKLPEGSVFITGLGVGGPSDDVFVTRFPCTEAGDGKMLPVVRDKPPGMSDDEWCHLCGIHCGLIVFATPKSPDGKLLPEIIANGDLDGDYYLILWDKVILSHISPVVNSNDPVVDSESDSEQSDDDPWISQSVEVCTSSKLHQGVVRKRIGNDYLVTFEALEMEDQIMTKEEVAGDREFFDGISGHRGKGIQVEVEVSWVSPGGAKSKAWQSVATLRIQENVVDDLAQYALKHNLLKDIGWRWADTLVWQAQVVEILRHKVTNNCIEYEVLYDDGETAWEELSDQEGDVDLICAYAEKEDLLQKKSWSWLKPHIAKAKGEWFDRLQTYLVNTQRLLDNNQLTTLLHRKFRESHDGTDSDQSVSFGRAYKQALDIGKHGGKVDLPLNLRSHIKEKLHKYITFR